MYRILEGNMASSLAQAWPNFGLEHNILELTLTWSELGVD